MPLATSVCTRQQLVTGLISLDVSGTQLGDAGLDKVAAWTPWLRELYAAGNGAPGSCCSTYLGWCNVGVVNVSDIDERCSLNLVSQPGSTIEAPKILRQCVSQVPSVGRFLDSRGPILVLRQVSFQIIEPARRNA